MRKFIQWLGIGSLITASGSAFAVTPNAGARPTQGENSGAQYNDIARRNVFGLKEATQTASTNTPPPQDPAVPKLTLTGITTILGNKLALFKVQFPGEGGKPGKEDSLMLSEGQRESGIEVLQIDEKAKRVRVNNSGRMMPIEFDKDSLKSGGSTNSTAAPTGTAPGQNPNPPGFRVPRLPSRNSQAPAANGTTPSDAPPPPPNPFSRAPAASYGVTNGAATTAAAANAAYPSNNGGVYQNTTPGTEPRSEALTPTGLTPEQIATLRAAAAAADAQSQAARQVPAPLQRPPTMPELPQ